MRLLRLETMPKVKPAKQPTVSHPKPHPDCEYCKAAKYAVEIGRHTEVLATKKVKGLSRIIELAYHEIDQNRPGKALRILLETMNGRMTEVLDEM